MSSALPSMLSFGECSDISLWYFLLWSVNSDLVHGSLRRSCRRWHRCAAGEAGAHAGLELTVGGAMAALPTNRHTRTRLERFDQRLLRLDVSSASEYVVWSHQTVSSRENWY